MTINGSSFNTSNVLIVITGTNCSPCTVPNNVLTSKGSNSITGPVTLNNAGTFSVSVQNGSGGPQSGSLSLSIGLPSVTSLSTSPNPPAVGQQFSLTIDGSNFNTSNVLIVITGMSCSPCTVPNNVLTSKGSNSITGPVTLNNTGSFNVSVQNGSGGPQSGTLSLTVNSATPSVSSLSTSPNPPVMGQQFSLTLNGSNFNTANVLIVITGTSCSPCTLPNNVLTSKTSTSITGPVTLNNSGTFSVSVQNGSGGPQSGTLSLTVNSATPSVSSLSTSPNPPVMGQQFSLTLNGSNFNTANVLIVITGTSCSPCTVPNNVLTSKTSTSITGPVTLNNSGTFNVSVQNGSGGSQSGSLSLSVNSPTPSVSSLSSNPNPAVVGQQFSLTINGSNFDTSNVLIVITGTSCGPCTVPNNVLTSKGSNSITGPVTLNNSGSFSVSVQNGSGGPQSGTLSLTVGSATPSITSLSTSPSPPVVGQQFSLTINGTNFDTSNVLIVISGASCSPCTVPNNVLTSKTSTSITGPVTLNNSGTFSVSVQNGSGGPQSGSLSLAVGSATPSVTSLSTGPSPPVVGQQFSLTINGSSFDTSNVLIVITGTSCSPCTVPNNVLTAKTSTSITGPVTLNNSGTFNVSVQNGSGGPQSGNLSLSVGAAAPSVTSLSTNPDPPVMGQQFSLTINGSNFNASNVLIVITGTNCSPCTVPNNVLTAKSSTTITGPLTLNNSGTFSASVQNGSGGPQSSTLSLTVGPPTPSVTSLSTSPNPPVVGQQLSLTINGSNFNASNVLIVITGTNCSPCTVPNNVLTAKSSTTITGPVTLNNSGTFSVSVQNGSGGPQSGSLSLSLGEGTPTITSLSTSPNPPVVGQQFSLTLNGSNFDTSNVLIVITGTSCSPCTVPNNVLTAKSSTTITGPVTLNNSGTFSVSVQNGSGGPQSGSLSLSLGAGTPMITNLSTSPNLPVVGQQFSLTINGSNFNTSNVLILITGTNCSPCTVPDNVLTAKSSTTITGPVTLNNSGTFSVSVQNGSGGPQSGSLSLSLGAGTPNITSLSTSPNLPVVGQQFSLTINGSNFDPASALIVITGTNCSPCTVPNNVLTGKSATTMTGPVTLNNSGTFSVSVQNGSGGPQSGNLWLSLGAGTPTVTSLSTSPNPPVLAQQFDLTINGNNFDTSDVLIVITGTSCSPCTVPNNVLTSKTSTSITGPVTLNNGGTFSVSVQNGSGGPQSGTRALSVGLGGPSSGSITTSPTTCQVSTVGGTCSISLLWTLQNTTSGLITVTDALGNQKVVNPVTGSSGTQPIPWLQALPQSYTFYLWDYTGGKQGAQLAKVAVSATGPGSPSGTPSVNVTPSRNTPGSIFTIYGSGLASGPATIDVQAPGASSSTLVGQASVGADGTFSYPYTTQASNANGLYTVWAVDNSGKKSSTGSFTLAQTTPSSIPTCQSNTTTSGCNGDPINTATGNYTYQRTDLTIPGRGLPFSFTRTYNSQDGTAGTMGAGWTHSYMASLVQNSDNSITIRMPDGQVVVFDSIGGGYVSRFNGVYSTLQSPSSGTLILTTKAQISYRFTGNQLSAVSDRNGNTVQLTYSGSNLTAITDTTGRQYSLQYDGSGHLTSLTDPLSRTLQYAYDNAGNLISFTEARSGQFTYTYDGAHEMLTAVDPLGNTFLTNTYDGSGHVSSQADGLGNQWSYSYDANTLITTITDPNGKTSSQLHDSSFELLRATDTLGNSDQYQYDPLGNRISLQDRNGNTTLLNYDTNGNVIAATDAQSNIQAAAYDAQSNPLSRTDTLGNQATFTYDSNGNLVTSVDPLGNKTVYAYNSAGQLTSKTDALGRTTQYSYDTAGNLLQVADPLGNKTAYTCDAAGRRTSTTDANGFITNTAYDANDNVISVTDALGNETQYTYDGNNNRIAVTDPRGKTTTYSYDANQKLLVTTDALGNKVTNAYDNLRNLASVTDQLANVTRYSYDSENRLTGSTDPLGKTTAYEYDGAGNRIQVTDPLGDITAYGYDSLNRQISIKDPLGNQATTAYDAASHVLTKTDAAGNATNYTYDAYGRQTSIVDAAGGQVNIQFDQVGNRTQISDARGQVTQFSYDGMNRLTTTTDPLGNAANSQYDTVGNLVQTTDGNGNSKAYQYDGNRRETDVTYSTGGSVQFTYDANGNRTKMVDLVGTSIYSYDDLNRLQTYTSPAGASLTFSYDGASNRTAIQYAPGNVVHYTFDAANRTSSVTDWSNFSTSYAYDAAGRLSSTTFPNGTSASFSYDPVGRTTNIQYSKSATSLYSETVTWSANGNPLSTDISGLNGGAIPSESDTYAYDSASRLAAVPFGPVSNDKNGNVSAVSAFGQPTVFSYDLNNRATSISSVSTSAQMKYFGDGKLAELTTGNGTTRYLQDPGVKGNRILAELDANGNILRGYIQGLGMVSVLDGPSTYYFMHNLQGSTVATADGAGTVLATYRYDPFGHVVQSTGGLTYPFTFLGRYSLLTMGDYSITTYRLYDARAGRFVEPDPTHWQVNAEESPFLYAGQSPVQRIDPSGLSWWSDYNPFDVSSKLYSFADNQDLVAAASDYKRAVGNFALGTGDALLGSSLGFAECVKGVGTGCYQGVSSAVDSVSSYNNSSKNLLASVTNIIKALQGKQAISPSDVPGFVDPLIDSIPGARAKLETLGKVKDAADLATFVFGLFGGDDQALKDIKQYVRAGDAYSDIQTVIGLLQQALAPPRSVK